MMKSFMKAAAALAVAAGSSVALAQPFCSSPELFIPDSGGASVQDTITVSGGPASVTDLAITVNISHTWDSDLTFVLVHNGQTLNLSAGNGGGGDNFINTRFIDTAATNIVFGAAPFTGDFQPEGGDPFWSGTISIPAVYLANCAGFFGGDGNGAWDLVIDDTVGGDVGTLHNWCIDFAPGAPPPPPPPPPGDDCGTPIIAVDGSNAFTTVDATTDSAFTCGFGVQKDVHFTYTATANGSASFSTCGTTFFDTVMMLGTSCGANDLGCLDDFCGLQTTLFTGVTVGQVVHITIGGYNGQSGAGALEIAVSAPPANDECLTATVVGEGTHPFDNTGATTNGSMSCGFGGSTGFSDIWFEYIAGFTGDAVIDTCGQTAVDTQLAVFDACGGVEIACNDDSCGTLQSKVTPFAVTNGGHYWVRLSGWSSADFGSGTMTIGQYVPPPPGDDCLVPFLVGDGVHAFDTTGTDNSYPGACGASGASPDVFFLWTVGADGCADITTCGQAAFDTVLEVIGSCGGPTIVCNDDSCGLQSSVQVPGVTAGQQLLVRVSGYAGQSGAGSVTLSVSPSNPYTHPTGTEEPEPCFEQANDTANGGCNSAPEIFGSISCGETVTGTSWYDGAVLFVRDTDSFAFTILDDATVTFTGQAEFPVQTFILNGGCPWGTFYAAANNSACGPDFTISAFLTAGSYNFWVGGSGAGGNFYCAGGANRYWATMSVDTGCAAPCDGDVNCDFALDGFDVETQEKAVGGDLTDYCQPDPDFNGDFALDGFDVEAVEIVVGGGPCP